MARRAYHRFCPLSMALEDVGDRWTLHIVYALLDGPKRYVDLQAFLRGAGSNVLADRGDDAKPETFDQTWAVPDPEAVTDEIYRWSVDGVEFELSVSGCFLTRTPGRGRKPIVTLSMTRSALDAVLAGRRTIADAANAKEVALTGPPDAIRRMFLITGFPAAMHGF